MPNREREPNYKMYSFKVSEIFNNLSRPLQKILGAKVKNFKNYNMVYQKKQLSQLVKIKIITQFKILETFLKNNKFKTDI